MKISSIPKNRSAEIRTSTGQNIGLVIGAILVTALLVLSPTKFFTGLILFSIGYYFFDAIFYMTSIIRGTSDYEKNSSIDVNAIEDWPKYTILCPMYKESRVLPQFVDAMNALNYEKEKLQILLLLEEDDVETVQNARDMNLPSYFEIIVVPHSLPKTKPKACNVGLEHATGEYVVIYDAEDIPDPDQLRLAAATHLADPDTIGCVQAKLNFYNADHNYMTRLFTLEYSLWFEVVLPGLMSMNAPLPLGGTSNHFPTKLLCESGAWDPYNVTEDADLGMRLAQHGYRTVVIDSTTMEEGNGVVESWIKQRSRWIKGYMQTYLVHMRNLGFFWQSGRRLDILFIHVILGMRSFGILLSGILLSVFLMTTAFKLLGIHLLELPTSASYALIFNFVFINLLYVYTYSLGIAKRGEWYLIKAIPFVPLYWLYMHIAAFQAAYELVVKPYYWQKTQHGLHLIQAQASDEAQA